MKCVFRSDTGCVRNENQDSYLVKQGVHPIFAVADGMGGHKGGSVASAIAIGSISSFTEGKTPDAKAVGDAVLYANASIFDEANKNADLSNMGTTLTMLWRIDHSFYLAHVGDSRCYLLRDGVLTRISVDHSLVNELVLSGAITEAEARVHPRRNIVTRAVGTKNQLKVDVGQLDIKKGDRWLLCSDGLTEHLDENDILHFSSMPNLDTAADSMLNTCLERGGSDNITLILLEENDEG